MLYRSLLLIYLVIASTGCQRHLSKTYDEGNIKQQYERAVARTAAISQADAVNNLLSVPLDSSSLLWKNENGHDYVLAIMWKSAADLKYYKNDCNTGFYNTGNRYTFVSIAPQLRDLCRGKRFGTREGLNLRIEQILGLPPKSNKDYFVEVWVRPQNLLRPCRDTEIDDRTCSLAPGDTTAAGYKTFLQWLTTNNAGYPFTQLGYTYDWNKNNKRHEGISEFLIDKNSAVMIKGFVATGDYCFVNN